MFRHLAFLVTALATFLTGQAWAAPAPAAAPVPAPAAAAAIVCDGVLGNSGAEGKSLVRFSDARPTRGMGVVVDRTGALWDRAGEGTLNRYAPDGRLLAQYRIPKGAGQRDLMTHVGDLLVMQVGTKLCTLSIDAPAGTEATPLKREAECISYGSAAGQIALGTKEGVFLFNPTTGDAKPVATLKGVDQVEVGPDGAVYVVEGGDMHKYVGGQEVTDGWPRRGPGERAQLVDGWWFGNAWHGTIRRYTATMDPSPGVVLGGASGSFIGHLDQNGEVSNGRGLARVGPDLYAVSGMGGILHLLRWDEAKQQMQIVRRIGAVPSAGGIGLDRDGRVWWFGGVWQWADRPDAPLEFGVNAPDAPGIGQAVMLESDLMVAPGCMWGKPAFYRGKLTTELGVDRIETPCALKRGTTGTAVYADQGKLVLLAIERTGAGQTFQIDSGGAYRGDIGPVALKAATPGKEWTSLAMKDATTLLAAVDGQVVEMVRDGKDWKESRRWNSWGAGETEKFGAAVWITADDGRLWVADRERHRVVCFDLATGKPLAAFGTVDKKGADLAGLALPETIAARGRRAVVFDSENQRLVKLRLP